MHTKKSGVGHAESTQQDATDLTTAEEKILAHLVETCVKPSSPFWVVFGGVLAAGACFIFAGAMAAVDSFREQTMFDGASRDMFWLGMFSVFLAYQVRSQLHLVRIIQHLALQGTSN